MFKYNLGKVLIRFSITVLIGYSLNGCATVQDDWNSAQKADSKRAYRSFLSKHSDSEFSEEARKKVDEFEWMEVKKEIGTRKHRIYLYNRFVKDQPNNFFVPEAIKKIMILEWEIAKENDTIQSYEKFLKKYPSCSYTAMATDSIDRIKEKAELQDYNTVSKSKTRTELEKFLNDYPNSKHRATIQRRLSLFTTKTIAEPLVLKYEELGLSGPISGEEAYEKYSGSNSMNITMPGVTISKRADGIVVLHKNSNFPGVLVGSIYGGKLNLKPYTHSCFPIVETPPENKHPYFRYNFKLLLPVGTEFVAPKDQWIQWKNVEFKNGVIKFLEFGIVFSKGMEITLLEE